MSIGDAVIVTALTMMNTENCSAFKEIPIFRNIPFHTTITVRGTVIYNGLSRSSLLYVIVTNFK